LLALSLKFTFIHIPGDQKILNSSKSCILSFVEPMDVVQLVDPGIIVTSQRVRNYLFSFGVGLTATTIKEYTIQDAPIYSARNSLECSNGFNAMVCVTYWSRLKT